MYKSWKSFWPFIRPYKGKIILALLLGQVFALLTLGVPVMINVLILGLQKKTLLDDSKIADVLKFLDLANEPWVIGLDSKTLVTSVAIFAPLFYLVYGIVRYFNMSLVRYLGECVISDIRVAIMNKFMELDVLFTGRQKKGSGAILSRTLNDTLVLQAGLGYYADLIREPIVIIYLIGFMFFTNWQISLGCFVFLPLFAGVIRFTSRSLKKYGHLSQESLEEVTKTLKEGIDGVRVIQSFNLQNTIKEKFYQQVQHYLDKRRKIIRREELAGPLNEWFAAVMGAGIIIYQVQLIWAGESDLSSFIAFIFAAGMLNGPVKKTQQALINVQQTVVALERLDEVLASTTQVQEPQNPQLFPHQWSEIQFRNVSYSYNETPVLKNVNLTIKRGEIVALVGESGSGKSTLAGLLQRFFDPKTGEILIGSTPINQMTTAELRAHIGFVTQDVFLFDDTIENNIRYGNLNRDPYDIREAAQMANAIKFVEATPEGFGAVVGERGGKLSGGEKQRISIARAVFKDPPILILDEATSALDSVSELEVQKGIEKLLDGRTALVIAHRLSTIINSDRIIVMKDGQIVEEGDHQSLINQNQEYARFFKLQYT